MSANAALYVCWGHAVPGREQKSLEVFMHAQEFNATLEKQGKIAAHRTYIATTGSMERFAGFMVLEGSIEQLRAVIDSPEWQQIRLKAEHLVEGVDVIHCVTGAEIPRMVQQIVDVRRQLGLNG
ncbi:MAG TPA: hypothetical protein VMI75_06500 [Polyangiaceae bacterium]|nr:hypothetical protein [Polyangiaceae bacterium]